MSVLITFTTDFGLTDAFVGVLRGVVLSIAPDSQIIDITHGIRRQSIEEGAFVLANSILYFPPKAIHLCVVDPGVGSTRRAIAVQVGETLFVGPDNGVLSWAVEAVRASVNSELRVFELNNPRYWLARVSNTFHGRDIFAPVAAHLANGVPLDEMGAPLDRWITLAKPAAALRVNSELVGRVIYIDTYGNLVTNITQDDLKGLGSEGVRVEIGNRVIGSLSNTYADVARGEFAALIGSPWKLEVAIREGNAAQALNAQVGDEVIVRRTKDKG